MNTPDLRNSTLNKIKYNEPQRVELYSITIIQIFNSKSEKFLAHGRQEIGKNYIFISNLMNSENTLHFSGLENPTNRRSTNLYRNMTVSKALGLVYIRYSIK